MSPTMLAIATLLFAVGTAVPCCLAAVRGRPLSRDVWTAIAALELAMVCLVAVQAAELVRVRFGAKEVAYLAAGVGLVPAVVLGAGSGRQARAAAAAVACVAAGVLALRIAVVV